MACQTNVVKVLHESPNINSQPNLLPLDTQNILQFFSLVKINFYTIFCYSDTRGNKKPRLNHVHILIKTFMLHKFECCFIYNDNPSKSQPYFLNGKFVLFNFFCIILSLNNSLFCNVKTIVFFFLFL